MAQDPYVYAGTDVLINNFNERDQDRLDIIEARLVMPRFVGALSNIIGGKSDLEHLCEIHSYLFGDVYPWAGQIRTIAITKAGEIEYSNPLYIEDNARAIFGKLAKENHLCGLDVSEFVGKLAELMGNVHVLHPFREGNTRTLQIFAHYVARRAGFELDWTKCEPQEIRAAGLHAATVDDSHYARIITRILVQSA